MYKIILGAYFLIASTFSTQAQFNCNVYKTTNLDISTVVGSSTNWRIINSPPAYPISGTLDPIPFVPIIFTDWDGKKKLSIKSNAQTVNRNLSNGSGNFKDIVPYIFERQFCISESNTTLNFNLSFTADDYVILSLINLTYNTPISTFNSFYDLSNPSATNYTVTIPSLSQGTYAIRASVINYGGPGINFWLNGNITSSSMNRLIETGAGTN